MEYRINRIILVRSVDHHKLWTKSDLSWDVGLGFLYGMLYCIQKIAPPGRFRVIVRYSQNTIEEQVVLHNIIEMTELLPRINFLFAPLYWITSLNFLTNNMAPGYNYWLRNNHDRGEQRATLIADNTGEFLQGLFSVLDAFNVSRIEVLLTKPYKEGIFYNVEGLKLPTPR